jgi:hypothetical protein
MDDYDMETAVLQIGTIPRGVISKVAVEGIEE